MLSHFVGINSKGMREEDDKSYSPAAMFAVCPADLLKEMGFLVFVMIVSLQAVTIRKAEMTKIQNLSQQVLRDFVWNKCFRTIWFHLLRIILPVC